MVYRGLGLSRSAQRASLCRGSSPARPDRIQPVIC